MRKLAIFVEGQTEAIFLDRLIREISSRMALIEEPYVEHLFANGGRFTVRAFTKANPIDSGKPATFHITVFNSCNDSRVISDVNENYNGLVSQGYLEVIALRDVFPFPPEQLDKFRSSAYRSLTQGPVPAHLVLGVMEVESWFLAEYNHFSLIHNGLTMEILEDYFGESLNGINLQLRPNPALDLINLYGMFDIIYDKSRSRVERTVNALDFNRLLDQVKFSFDDLRRLIERITLFFTTPFETSSCGVDCPISP